MDRIAELVYQYADLGLGMVDASVIAACERLDQTELVTLNRRHFSVVTGEAVSCTVDERVVRQSIEEIACSGGADPAAELRSGQHIAQFGE